MTREFGDSRSGPGSPLHPAIPGCGTPSTDSRQLSHPETGGPDAVAIAGGKKAALFPRHVAITLLPVRKSLLERGRCMALHRAAAPQHFELRIEHQQGLQQVLLGPEREIMQHRLARIVGGKEDVMGVDQHAAGDAGYNFEILAYHIAADPDDVT